MRGSGGGYISCIKGEFSLIIFSWTRTSPLSRKPWTPHGPQYERPADRFGSPTALFGEPLAVLEHRLDHLWSHASDARILEDALELVTLSTDCFGEKMNGKVLGTNPAKAPRQTASGKH